MSALAKTAGDAREASETKRILIHGNPKNLQISKSSPNTIQVCVPLFLIRRISCALANIRSDSSIPPQELHNRLKSKLESLSREFTLLRNITSTSSDGQLEFICVVVNSDIIELIKIAYPPSASISYDIIDTIEYAQSKYSEYFEILSPPASFTSSTSSSPHYIPLKLDEKISTIPFIDRSGRDIYLSGETGANDPEKIKELGITHILNISVGIPNYYEDNEKIKYKRIPIEDNVGVNLKEYFPTVFSFITNALESGGRVLVHCFAGKSRSASFVIAYLMHIHKMSYMDVFKHVQSHRSVVEPNLGFELQLYAFERQCL